MLEHHRAATHHAVVADTREVKQRGADADVRARADLCATAEATLRREVRELTDDAIVFDDAGGVENRAVVHAGFGVHHHAGHGHHPGAEKSSGRNDARGVNERRQLMPLRLQSARDALPGAVVADAQRDDARRLAVEKRSAAQHREPQHLGTGGNAVVDEAVDRMPAGLHHFCDDASVATGSEHENARGRHAPQYMDGVKREQHLRLKRLFDIAASAAGLVVAAPALVAAATAVRVSMGAPVFFRQTRPGKGGKPFSIFKFRTMSDARGPDGALLPDAERLTAVGRFIRESSLDELPQLLNVLKGDMSLVGPRPLLMRYLPRYSERQARRHEMRPGITGLAQVRGRNSLSWPQKFELDVKYVDEFSLWLDAKILLETVSRVVKRDGIAAAAHATMPEFMGNEAE